MMLYIARADLEISIEDVTKTYGDVSISSGIENFTIYGLGQLNQTDYVFGIYDQDNNRVTLRYNSNVGEYRIILTLNESLRTNFNYGESQVVATYTITQKEITQFEIRIDGGILRENGTVLNDKISIEFNAGQFVDGKIPEYEVHFTRDGTSVSSVISEGTYYVTIVFVDGNYNVTATRSFIVYEAQSYLTLIIVVGVIVGIIIIVLIVVLTIRINRRRNRRNLQKEQLKEIEKKIKSQSNSKHQFNHYADNTNKNGGDKTDKPLDS